jgi:hypothetical protein
LTHVVNDNVDTLDIDTTTKDVGGDKDTLLESLEGSVSRDTLVLGQTRVNTDGGEVALAEQTVELCGAIDRLYKDADLVELELIKEIVELAVLGRLFELDEVLLETVKGQLCLVIDVDLEGLM